MRGKKTYILSEEELNRILRFLSRVLSQEQISRRADSREPASPENDNEPVNGPNARA
ncbi:MAG: hypothetical protein HY335_07100 [Deinococcus sp.]|nr:hypothetical protein [Deinococcus sp.]